MPYHADQRLLSCHLRPDPTLPDPTRLHCHPARPSETPHGSHLILTCHTRSSYVDTPIRKPVPTQTPTHLVEPQWPVRFEQLRRAVERGGVCPRRGGLDSDFDDVKGLRRQRDELDRGMRLGRGSALGLRLGLEPGLGLKLGLELGLELGLGLRLGRDSDRVRDPSNSDSGV